MSERARLEQEFKTYPNSLTICQPGKYECEALYVPYFDDQDPDREFMRGGRYYRSYTIRAEDKQEFPELKRRRTVTLYERDDGFVCEG